MFIIYNLNGKCELYGQGIFRDVGGKNECKVFKTASNRA